MLQLPYRDHARHMAHPLSSSGSVSLAPRHAIIYVLRPIPGGMRSSEGGVHLLLLTLGDMGCVASCAVSAIGAWLGNGRGAGVPGCRAADGGMCGRSSVHLYSSKWMADILGISMNTTSSSTLMHQVLRLRVRRRRKFIESISYYAAHSTFACLSLTLWNIREKRLATTGCVFDKILDNRETRPLTNASDVIQLTWRKPISTTSLCEESAIEGQTFPLNVLYQSLDLDLNFSAAAAV